MMHFFKNLAQGFAIFLIASNLCAAEVQTECKIPETLNVILETFYSYKLDSYKNVCIEIKQPSSDDVVNIKVLIDEMQRFFKNHALYITFPIVYGDFSDSLEQLGCKLCECSAESKTLTYIYLNGRNIPELNYAYTAAAVCLLRTNPKTGVKEILLISEPSKNIANIIGGISEKGEMPDDTVIREVREEIGLKIDPKNLKLLAVSHTVRPDKKSCVGYYYLCDKFEGTPKADGVEVSEYAWVPVKEILKDGAKFFGKPFYPLYQRLLKGELRNQTNGGALSNKTKAYQYFAEFPLDDFNEDKSA